MNKWHFPDSGNRVICTSYQASALSNQTVEKPRLLQRPMLARSKGGLTPKLGGSSPCSDSSSINKIAKKDQSMSKLLTIIDQQSTPQSEEIKLQVDNIQQPRINFSSLNTPTDTPTEQIRDKRANLITVQELDNTPSEMLGFKAKSEVFIQRPSKRSLLGNLMASASSTTSADDPSATSLISISTSNGSQLNEKLNLSNNQINKNIKDNQNQIREQTTIQIITTSTHQTNIPISNLDAPQINITSEQDRSVTGDYQNIKLNGISVSNQEPDNQASLNLPKSIPTNNYLGLKLLRKKSIFKSSSDASQFLSVQSIKESPHMKEESKSNRSTNSNFNNVGDDQSSQQSSCELNPFEICKDQINFNEDSTPFLREEESEINIMKRMNSSLKKRSDSSHFLPHGGLYNASKRPNSIGGFGLSFGSPTFQSQSNFTNGGSASGGGTATENQDVQMEDVFSNRTQTSSNGYQNALASVQVPGVNLLGLGQPSNSENISRIRGPRKRSHFEITTVKCRFSNILKQIQ
eukprot:403362272